MFIDVLHCFENRKVRFIISFLLSEYKCDELVSKLVRNLEMGIFEHSL